MITVQIQIRLLKRCLLFQVYKGYKGSPGCVVLKEDPTVILAGDAFVHSNFDGCIESALSVIKSLENIQSSKNKL